MFQDNLFRELVVDNFAGGGGASTGMELALGYPVDIAVNHDADAIAMHKVNHPTHYTDGKIEVIDFIEDKSLNFHRGNAVKYIARAGKKDPSKEIEDLQKAVWYLDREIERLKGGDFK